MAPQVNAMYLCKVEFRWRFAVFPYIPLQIKAHENPAYGS